MKRNTSLFLIFVVGGIILTYLNQFLLEYIVLALILFFLLNSLVLIFAGGDSYRYKRSVIGKRLILIILVVISIIYVYIRETNYNVASPQIDSGGITLAPANDPLPTLPTGCSTLAPPVIPADSLMVFLGNSLEIATKFPYNLIFYQGKPIISIDKDQEGHILLSASVWDTNGMVIGEILNNKFIPSSTRSYQIVSSTSTLEIYDQSKQILYFDFLNPTAIKLLGLFYNDSNLGISIEENEQYVGKLLISEECFRNSSIYLGGPNSTSTDQPTP